MRDLSRASALLPDVIAAVRLAAEPVMERFGSRQTVWDKDQDRAVAGPSAGNPVSEADLLADEILRRELVALLPGSGWLSEETVDGPERLASRAVWIVDPIDGTREYVDGVPEFAISVALAVDGDPVLAVLLNPAENELFTATRGGGAHRDGLLLAASARTELDGAVLLASATEKKRGEFAIFEGRMTVTPVGSTAYKLALLAAGTGDVYFTRSPRNEWDVAAGILLCREAGATVTDLGGGRHRFNRRDPLCRGVVACGAGLHAEVMSLIGEVGTLE
jgi:myo-inositol-1(or 4)-monophosphatase